MQGLFTALSLLLLLTHPGTSLGQDLKIDVNGPSRSTSRRLAPKLQVKVFLIAPEDNGRSGKKIGCNDSVVAVRREIKPTPAPLRAALSELLGMPQEYGTTTTLPTSSSAAAPKLYNALHRSELYIKGVTIRRGEAMIHLGGRLTSGGVCDTPRIASQIEETARQFPAVKRVKVFINGMPLSAYLSERD
jgi:hypothetical protein